MFLNVADVGSPALYMATPPKPKSSWRLLPERVELLTSSVPAPPRLAMPPPKPALLLERVELLTVAVPSELAMPPPTTQQKPLLALLPEMLEC